MKDLDGGLIGEQIYPPNDAEVVLLHVSRLHKLFGEIRRHTTVVDDEYYNSLFDTERDAM